MLKKKSKVIILTLAVVLVLAIALNTEASGTTYYVATDGNDSNPGTEAMPFRTIQKGIDMAQGGDTVYVRAGTYYETISITNSGTESARIFIAGYPGERPVIDGQYQIPNLPDAECDPVTGNCFNYGALVSIEGSYVVFEGFEVERSRGRGIRIWPNDHNEINDCWVHDNRGDGMVIQDSNYNLIRNNRIWLSCDYAPYPRGATSLDWGAGIALQRSSHTTIRDNEVFNNWGEGILPMASDHIIIEDNVVYDNFSANIYCERTSYTTVRRNLVYHTNGPVFQRGGNPCPGLGFADETHQFGDTPQRTRNVTVINNLVIGHAQNFFWWEDPEGQSGLIESLVAYNTFVNAHVNSGTPQAIAIESGVHTDARFENNIILQDDGIMASVVSGSSIYFSHNLWSRPAPTNVSGSGDVIDDPQLVNPDAPLVPGAVNADWYKLQESSPARDGASVIAEVTEDFFGNMRGDDPDIGAHEYGATPPSPTATPPSPTATPPLPKPRVTDGLQVLYTFEEGSGATVRDVSGVGTPLNLTIENGSAASWLPGALSINSPVLISSAGAATKIIDACRAADEITLEAWTKPANTSQDGPARIVTLSDGAYVRDFTLAQEESTYDTRLRTTVTSDNGTPSLTAGTVTISELSHVVYTRDASGVARFYVDGVEVGSRSDITGDFSNWDGDFHLGLANEFGADRAWLGELHLVAIYDRALSQDEVMQNFRAGPPLPPRIWLPLVLKHYDPPGISVDEPREGGAIHWLSQICSFFVSRCRD